MTFTWPWMLVALAPVAAAACWALWRPAKRTTTVPAISLWREALASLARDRQHRTRRVRAAWLCLLCGAVAVAAAMARPKVQTARLRRHVVVAVYPSAELAGDDGEMLHKAAGLLLARLSPIDRVQLVLPNVLGGRSEWLSPAQADRRIDELPILPARADELSVALPPAGELPTIVFAPAGLDLVGGGDVSLVELPTALPAATVDALGATGLPGGALQVFVAARNHTDGPLTVTVQAQAPAGDEAYAAGRSQAVTIPAGERTGVTLTLPALEKTIAVTIVSQSGGELLDRAYLALRPVRVRRVAMVGRDDPLLRRYVSMDESLVLVGDAAGADIVIANGLAAPGGARAAMVFGATAIKPFSDNVAALQHVLLDRADVAADHPVMSGVDLAGVAMRELPTWPASEPLPWMKVLAGLDGGAFIVVSDTGRRPHVTRPTVYVLPDVSTDNTNWTMLKSFVIFMANAVRWLAPGDDGGEYGYGSPVELARPGDWRPDYGRGRVDDSYGPLLRPGVYTDADGTPHALSLVGLHASLPAVPVEQAVDAAQLGEAVSEGFSLEIWPILAALGAALWLVGWTLRVVR